MRRQTPLLAERKETMSPPEETAQARLYQVAGTFRERLPAYALRAHVDRVWTNELAAPAELEIVPDGCIDIYWTGAALHVAGPNTEIATARIENPATLVGVRFLPGVAARWLGNVSAAQLLNAHPPLDTLWGGRTTAELCDRLAHGESASAAAAILEQALIDRLPQVASADPIIGATVAVAAKPNTGGRGIVRRLVEEFGLSERTLRRRCQDAFGYGPKTLHRILRFQRVLGFFARGRAPLGRLAIEAGYADQAHLAREVRRLSGQSPSRLMSELQS